MNVALSTWTLDPVLAARYPDAPVAPRGGRRDHTGSLEIGDLPAEARAHGFTALEVPHFHLPPDEPGRMAFAESARFEGIELQTLLIDDGDLTHPEHSARDEAWIGGWIETAGAMGFARVRIIAGKQPRSPETFARSLAAMQRLVSTAERASVRPSTENWFDLLATPEAVLDYLASLDGRLGLCADFGNWPPEVETDGLAKILPLAETIHAKAEFASDGTLDEARLTRQVGLAQAAGFTGAYVLVAGGPGDPWAGAERTRSFLDSLGRATIPVAGERA